MKIKDQQVKNFIDFMNGLELYESQKDGWALGARDSLLFMRATLFPVNPDEEIEGLDKSIIEALYALDQERSERFKQKVMKYLERDEMTKKMYSHLFDMRPSEEIEPSEALLIDLCYSLEFYLQSRPNLWVMGALDALRWVWITLFPFDATPTDDAMHATIKTVQRVEREWEERFENELRKRFSNDEMLRRICKELFRICKELF